MHSVQCIMNTLPFLKIILKFSNYTHVTNLINGLRSLVNNDTLVNSLINSILIDRIVAYFNS